MHMFCWPGGVFWTRSNTCDGVFLRKILKQLPIFANKNFIVDVWQGSRYGFDDLSWKRFLHAFYFTWLGKYLFKVNSDDTKSWFYCFELWTNICAVRQAKQSVICSQERHFFHFFHFFFVIPSISGLDFIRINKTSRAKTNKKAEIG